MDRVLFICTGNYYRSRFAEAVFNHRARREQLPWQAFSRGVAIHLIDPVVDGVLSPHTRLALGARRIPLGATGRQPVQLAERDLRASRLRFALKEAEHRRYLQVQFSAWEHLVHYWGVHDLDAAGPDEAIPAIEEHVHALLDDLAADRVPDHPSPPASDPA